MRDTGTTRGKGVTHWLMLDLLERKIRIHVQRIYEERGHVEGHELENWLKAQSEALRTLNAANSWGNLPTLSSTPDNLRYFRQSSKLVQRNTATPKRIMHPPKRLPASTSDLRDNSRNARQKSVLLCEVTRMHVKTSGKLCRQSQDLTRKEPTYRNT